MLWNPLQSTWITGSSDRTVRIWNSTAPHDCILTIDVVNPVSSLCLDSTGFVAVACDRTIRVFDLASGKLVQSNIGHTASIHEIIYSPLTHAVRYVHYLHYG